MVAGDAKQLPPTMFFKSTFDFEEDEEGFDEDAGHEGLTEEEAKAQDAKEEAAAEKE